MNLFEIFGKISLDTTGFQKALNIATSAITTATAAVTAFAGKAVTVGKDFDKAMSQVAATSGKTMKELEEEVGSVDTAWGEFNGNLRDYAQFMGSNTAFSATQAAEALNYMALAGYNAQTSMNMLPNVLNLAASGGIDLARASDMITDAQTALGLSLDETNVLVDEMAKTASKSNTSVAQLGDAILTIGGTAQFMSGGTKELNSVLGILADNGIKGSEAGTHLRNMLLKLSAPTDDGVASMNALGLSIYDAEGKMRSFESIFGDINSSMDDVSGSITRMYSALAEAEEGSKEYDKAMLQIQAASNLFNLNLVGAEGGLVSLDEALKNVGNEFENNALTDEKKVQLLSSIFNTRDVAAATALMGTTVERWDELGGFIEEAAGSADKMAKTQLDNLAGDTTLFKSAMEGAYIAVSDKLTPGIRKFVQFGTKGISNLTEAFSKKGLSGAMDEFGKILSEGLTIAIEELPGLAEAGASLLTSLAQGIVENLPTLVSTVFTIIQTMGTFIVENLPTLMTTLVEVINQIVTFITDPTQIATFLNMVLTVVQTVADSILENLPLLIETLLTLVTNLASSIDDWLPLFIDAALQIILALADGLLQALPQILAMLPTIIVSISNALLDMLPIIIDTGVELLLSLLDNMDAILAGLIRALPELISGLTTGLMSHLPEIINAGVKLFLGLIAALPEIILQLVMAAPAIIKALVDAFLKMLPEMGKLGLNLIKGLWEGIKDAGKWLWDKISGFFGGILDKIKGFFGIKSPSRVFAGIGEMLDKGLAKGIDDYADVALGATDNLAEDVMDSMGGINGDLDFTATGNGKSGVARGGIIINVYGAVGQDVEELADIVSQKISFAYRQEQAVWA